MGDSNMGNSSVSGNSLNAGNSAVSGNFYDSPLPRNGSNVSLSTNGSSASGENGSNAEGNGSSGEAHGSLELHGAGQDWGVASGGQGGQGGEGGLRAILSDPEGLAEFSKRVGYGATNLAKNHLLLSIDVEAFRLLQDPEDLSLNAHELFNMYVRKGAKREVGLGENRRSALKERVAAGGDALAPDMFDAVQDMSLAALAPVWSTFQKEAS
ncbi:hypothetical protein T484DRAFT_3594208 [Baffinella frigidus]|nr:hypothetical protein T484DRAFT_3594208 [Cryptophyta sp. CCMP2293]